jgi:HAD superfamily hydrolase (TIGR01509 family)
MSNQHDYILFDWGNTLMQDITEFDGPMYTWPQVAVIPHALEVLAELKPYWSFALATNAADSEEVDIQAALSRVGLDRYIKKVYCFRKINHKKPSKEFFAYILNDLGIAPKDAIMVGDNFEDGILGANQAGLYAIWLNRSDETRSNTSGHTTILNLSELPLAVNAIKNDIKQTSRK